MTGSYALGEATIAASSAASCGQQDLRARRLLLGAVAPAAAVVVVGEVRARGGLDAVGAVAEVDLVEVAAQDLVLRPPAREVVGQRRLAQLLEDRAVVLGGERDLHELLRDRRGALDGLAGRDVLDGRARDAAQVDAAVGVEAAVLDRDDRVLHHRRDVLLRQVDAALVAGQRADRLAAAVEDRRRRDGLLERVDRRQVGGDRHEHPEQGRDDREHAEAEEHDQHAQLADLEALLAPAAAPQTQPAHACSRACAGTGRPSRPGPEASAPIVVLVRS